VQEEAVKASKALTAEVLIYAALALPVIILVPEGGDFL
jgi:hypothetical protein